MSMRLRQLVIAAKDGPDVARQLRTVLGLGEPYADPGVAEFGLDNAVFAIGDQFLEVIWPVAETAPAMRFIARNGGDGGYMVILQTDDLTAQRARAQAQSIRSVWTVDLPDISATHFHPADTGGAILSIDEPRPAKSWRWGGPDWEANAVAGALNGAVFHSRDASKLRATWANLLGLPEGDTTLALDDANLTMIQGDRDALASFEIALPDPEAAIARAKAEGLIAEDGTILIGGTTFKLGEL